jgi:hypothetical protein
MTIRSPVPQVTSEDVLQGTEDMWFNLVSRNSVQLYDFDVTIDPASIAASTTVEQDFTVQGLGLNDLILSLTKPTLTSGIGLGGSRVKSENTLSVTFINATGGAIDPPSEEYTLVVIRQ